MNDIKQLLLNNGINNDILNHAKMMDIDLINLFKNKILFNFNEKKLDELTHHLMGIYGNYYVSLYYKSLGYSVKNEVPIYDGKKEITKADIEITDKNNIKCYIEVKLVKQILDSKIKYIDDKSTLVIYNNIYRKYEEIGKKLLKQTTKFKDLNKNIIVCVFSDTIIDDDILKKLNNMGVKIKKMAQKASDIEDYIRQIILNIKEEYSYSKREAFVV